MKPSKQITSNVSRIESLEKRVTILEEIIRNYKKTLELPQMSILDDIWFYIFIIVKNKRDLLKLCNISSQFNDIIKCRIKPLLFTRINLRKFNLVNDEILLDMPYITELSLWYNELVTNRGLFNLTAIKTLRLCGYGNKLINNIGISRLTSLTAIELESDAIKCRGIKRLPLLKSLNLDHNVTFIDKDISKLTNLTNLSLCHNEWIENDGISQLTNLTALDLRDNQYISSRGIRNLTNLKILSLEDNELIKDEDIRHLSNIMTLNLSRNNGVIKGFHEILPNITHLDLGYNEHIVDRDIKERTNLTHLNLEGNDYISGECIENFTNLTYLNLADTYDITIDHVRNLTKLVTLIINYSDIMYNDIKCLTKLRKICNGKKCDNNYCTGLSKRKHI